MYYYDDVSINDVDTGDVISINKEKYVCVLANHCQDSYYSLLYIAKEKYLLKKYNGNQLALDLKNDDNITVVEAYDFEQNNISIIEKSKYKNCFSQFIIFNMKK